MISARGSVKYGVGAIVAAFVLTGVAAFAGEAPPDGTGTQAQPALPVITMSAPETGGTASAGSESSNEFVAQELLSGYEHGVVESGIEIVRTQAELEALLRRIYSGGTPPEAPRINFSHFVLVYYSLGTKMHNNDKIRVRSGRLERGVLHVAVEIAHASGNCLATKSLNAPFVIAALPFNARQVRRAEYKITHRNYPCE